MIDFVPSKHGMQKHIAEYLYNFIKENEIKTIVETGVHFGTSSRMFLSALPTDGCLISFEPYIKPEILELQSNDSRWIIIGNKSEDKLEEFFEKNPEIDLFWHDSRHYHDTMMFEFSTAVKYCKYIGSHDICHNTGRGAWEEFIHTYPVEELHKEKLFGLSRSI